MYKILASFQRIKEIKAHGGTVYIRCASKIGRIIYKELKSLGVQVDAFLDKNSDKLKSFDGVPIIHPDQVYTTKSSKVFFIVIAMEDNYTYRRLIQELESFGFRPCIDYCDFSIDPDVRMSTFRDIEESFTPAVLFKRNSFACQNDMRDVDPSFKIQVPEAYNLIPNMDVPLTTFCSLKCKYCSHCIPYAHPPKHFDASLIINDIKKLISVSFISCLAIMGGEPFVYPNLDNFLDLYKRNEIDQIVGYTRIVTNGTVVPKDEIFCLFKKLKNFYVYISNYGERSKKLNELIEKCKKFEIPFYVCPQTNEWRNLGDFHYPRPYSKDEIKHLFAVCDARTCFQLLNGRFYSCPRIPLLNEDGLIPFSKNDFCEIRGTSEELLIEELHDYMYNKEYLEGCMYCDGQHMFSEKITRGS